MTLKLAAKFTVQTITAKLAKENHKYEK